MNNATPEDRHDDGDTFRYQKPEWLSAEKWAEIKAEALDLLRDPATLHAAVVALREEASE